MPAFADLVPPGFVQRSGAQGRATSAACDAASKYQPLARALLNNKASNCYHRLVVPIALFFLLFFSSAQAQAQAEIYRCGNSYSNTPCPGAITVDTTPSLDVGANPLISKVNLCKNYSGGLFWTDRHCSDLQSTLQRTVEVPSNLPFHDQVDLARSAHYRAEALKTRPNQTYSPSRPSNNSEHCQALTRRIKNLEGQARSGATARTMNRLTQERRELESERFKLKCPVRP